MPVRALALSGGGSGGSFQLGALGAIYRVYGFRPDFISGTSVGSVNGVRLAVAKPPSQNDPATILAAVAAGGTDSGLTALLALEAQWDTFLTVDDFFKIQPAFSGTLVEEVVRGFLNDDSPGSPPQSQTLTDALGEVSQRVNQATFGLVLTGAVGAVVGGIWAGDQVQKIQTLLLAVLSENALFNLGPVHDRLTWRDPGAGFASSEMVDDARSPLYGLTTGTPLYMATIALESGQLRYVDGMGNFWERDGLTPVMSALTDSDIDAALDANLNPLDPAVANQLKSIAARYRAALTAIRNAKASYNVNATPTAQRVALLGDIERNTERATYLLGGLQQQLQGLQLTVKVSQVRGVLASAAIPVLFDPVVLGEERYGDGGVREQLPLEIAARAGVTDVVGIFCDRLEPPLVDDMTNAGLLNVAARALGVAIDEVSNGDVVSARATGIPCTVIAPTFQVHSGMQVNQSLLEINSGYGWMRACDEMQPSDDAYRVGFRLLSDLITTFRMRSYPLERYIARHATFYDASASRDEVVTVRAYRWLIRELLATRADRGLPQHPKAREWWVGWVRELRGEEPFFALSVWNEMTPYSSSGTAGPKIADRVADPDGYAPDSGSLVDAGNDRVYWIVRGAVFFAPGETEATTAHTPVLPVPHGTVPLLPNVPRGDHLLADTATPNDVWIVHRGKRYQGPGLMAASGLSGKPVALVPTGGLAQVPVGGGAYWLGGLYVSDNAGTLLEVWDPQPVIEGQSDLINVGLMNRSQQAITVTGLTISSNQDSGATRVFTVTAPLPTIQASTFMWVGVRFSPVRPGAITGTISVTCNDPTVPAFSVPLSTSCTPLGAHGLLQIASSVDLGAIRVGQTANVALTLANVGGRDLYVGMQINNSPPGGQFLVGIAPVIPPGGSATVFVSCTPAVRGRLAATLSADALSQTSTPVPFRQHFDVLLSATGLAPIVFLAGKPLHRRDLPIPFGFPGKVGPAGPTGPMQPPGPTAAELTMLDFGAVAAGSKATRQFWIRNVGDAPLTVSSYNSTTPGEFGISNAAFPAIIAPGSELAVDAEALAPQTPGQPFGGALEFYSDDPARPRAVLQLVGRVAGPHLSLQPKEVLDFGTVNPGAMPTAPVTITSDGSDPVVLTKVGLSGTDFSVGGLPSLPATLASGSTLTVSVGYTPSPGLHNETLVLDYNGTKTSLSVRARS
jgi:hypothetical protein